MADFDGVIDPEESWADVPQLSTYALARGGVDGPMNAQAVALTKRTKFLKEKNEAVSNDIEKRTYITAKTFPFLAKGDFSRSSGTGSNDTSALLAYRDYCLENGTPFILPATTSDKGYLCLKTLDLTNVHTIRMSGTQLLTRSTQFDHVLGDWLVTIGTPLTSASDITGIYDIDHMQCEDLDFRQSALNGIYIEASALVAPFVRALKFNGAGVKCAPLWDSNVYMIAEHCGNQTTFAMSFIGNGDDNNANTITGLCHDAYHKGVRAEGSKNQLQRFHIERTYVLSNDDGATGLPSGDKYVNHEFIMTAGGIGTIDINDYDSQTTGFIGKASDSTTIALNLPSSVKISLYATNMSQINAQKSNVNFVQGLVGAEYNAVSVVKSNNFYVGNNSRINFSNVHAIGVFSNQDSASTVKFGRASTVGRQAGKLIDFIIDNTVNINETTSPKFIRCTFSGGITRLASSGFALLDDCACADVTVGNSGERQIWRGGQIGNYTTTAASYDIFLDRTRVTGNYSVSGVTSGGTRTMPGTRVEGMVTGWALPVSSGVVGEKTTRMGNIAVGQAIDYHCIAAATWYASTIRAS